MNLDILNNIILDPTMRRSISYAKARGAIEAAAKSRAEKRQAKKAVIEFLGGSIMHGDADLSGYVSKTVAFPDNSQARY